MTREEAINILDPETRRETMKQIPVFERIAVDQEACRLAVVALRAQQAALSNDPLTLEELRQMVGEPVWVHYLGEDGCYDCWQLVNGRGATEGIFESADFDDYGEWVAYRRKPEEVK